MQDRSELVPEQSVIISNDQPLVEIFLKEGISIEFLDDCFCLTTVT